jgi:hypothetical protein
MECFVKSLKFPTAFPTTHPHEWDCFKTFITSKSKQEREEDYLKKHGLSSDALPADWENNGPVVENSLGFCWKKMDNTTFYEISIKDYHAFIYSVVMYFYVISQMADKDKSTKLTHEEEHLMSFLMVFKEKIFNVLAISVGYTPETERGIYNEMRGFISELHSKCPKRKDKNGIFNLGYAKILSASGTDQEKATQLMKLFLCSYGAAC